MSAYAQFAVEQIRESGADEQTLADLAAISGEAKRLAEMADGTLKMLMASGVSETDDVQNPVDIGDIALRLVRLLEPVASRKGITLSALTGENIPAIPGDADALIQLVWNLLQNAITHSKGKTITLAVSAFDETETFVETEAADGVRITVNDDGAGIDPAILPRIFERGVSGKKDGSGIGLSICREIAKRHGGDITVQNIPGGGTGVTVIVRGTRGNYAR